MEDTLCYAHEPNLWERLVWKFQAWKKRNEPSNTEQHAIREFRAAGYPPIAECEDDPNKWMQENVLELLSVFAKQGHSGFSAPYCVELFRKLALHEPLVPLSGAEDEWNDVSGYGSEPCWQNNRCSHVFKDSDGRAYDIDGKIFREPNGSCYTSRDSRVYITFPYTPKSEYVDVPYSEATIDEYKRMRDKGVADERVLKVLAELNV